MALVAAPVQTLTIISRAALFTGHRRSGCRCGSAFSATHTAFPGALLLPRLVSMPSRRAPVLAYARLRLCLFLLLLWLLLHIFSSCVLLGLRNFRDCFPRGTAWWLGWRFAPAHTWDATQTTFTPNVPASSASREPCKVVEQGA